jgi:branched-chain amino acid transport system ATP-binding protein
MLELSDIDVHYGKNQVLKRVGFRVGEGEVVALVGANAAGKTTTLRTIMGLKHAQSGAIVFNGRTINDVSTAARVHDGIVLVPEGRQIFPKFSVAENLLMGAYHRSDRKRIEGDIGALFELFPRLGERRRQTAGSMSGGEQQMLAIARGLIAKPRCLLLDEPTLGLAPLIVQEIARIVRMLAGGGMGILLAEQNAAMALGVADRAYVLETGRVALEGTGADLTRDEAVRRNYLGT